MQQQRRRHTGGLNGTGQRGNKHLALQPGRRIEVTALAVMSCHVMHALRARGDDVAELGVGEEVPHLPSVHVHVLQPRQHPPQ